MITYHTVYISDPPAETEVLRVEDTISANPDVVQDALGNTTRNVRSVDARPMMRAHTWGDINCAITLVPSQPLPQRCAANVAVSSLWQRMGRQPCDHPT